MSEKKNKKNQKKKVAIASGIAGGLIFIMLIGFFMIIRSPTTPAYLNIESGEVQVDFGSGWLPASDGMQLSIEDKVRTLDGSAILVLYESIIVNMKQNTEIAIADLAEDNVEVKQASGTTWSKFTKLAGVSSYKVETPNTVATVRGTEFELTMDSIIVGGGEVDWSAANDHLFIGSMKKGIFGVPLKLAELTEEDKERIVEYKKTTMKSLRMIRAREINKHPTAYNAVKKFAGMEDDEAMLTVQKMDWGYADEDALIEKAPVRLDAIEKFVLLTKEIKKEKAELEELGYFEIKPDWLVERLKKEQVSEGERILPPEPGVAGARIA